jgi:triacylglycerol lipase
MNLFTGNINDQDHGTPLSSRLGQLFYRYPVDSIGDTESDTSMLTTRSVMRSKGPNSSTITRAAKHRSLPVLLPRLQSLSSPSMATEPAQPKSPTPLIRWLGSWSQPGCASSLGSNSPSVSSPPSPCLSLLSEAMNEDILPTTPPQARLPPSFYASRALSRPPPFLDNLTRSTLPIASMSSGLHLSRDPNTKSISLDDSAQPVPNAHVTIHSPIGSTSMDVLRSVRDRGINTVTPAPSPSPSRPTSWWWFQGDNKQDVDTLLEEEDRADSVGEEQSRLRKKCENIIQSI